MRLSAMRRFVQLALCLSTFSLEGCFFSFSYTSADSSGNNVTPSGEPCFTSTCGRAITIATIPDAENMIFSSSGRLFVSGGLNVYEITASSGAATGYIATPLSSTQCNFTGLAIIQTTLFAGCFDGSLWTASLAQSPVTLVRSASIPDVTAGNGLVDGPDGLSLYWINGPSGMVPKIVKINLNSLNITGVVSSQVWLSSNISFPNGLQRKGSVLFFTDSDSNSLGRIKRVNILPGGAAGAVENLAAFDSLPDDISFIDNDFIVPFYSSGKVARVSALGLVLQSTDNNSFQSPSQVRLGRPPLFNTSDLIITEKGVVGDNASSVGNRLTLYRKNN